MRSWDRLGDSIPTSFIRTDGSRKANPLTRPSRKILILSLKLAIAGLYSTKPTGV